MKVKNLLKILTAFIIIISVSFSTANAEKDGDIFYVRASETESSIQDAMNDPNINKIIFDMDIHLNLTKGFTINRSLEIVVDEDANITLNGPGKVAFKANLGSDKIFKFTNNGIIHFNDVDRAIFVTGEEGSIAEIKGDHYWDKTTGVYDIYHNTGYALAFMDHFKGKVKLENVYINVVTDNNNLECGLYLGNVAGKGEAIIKDSTLDIETTNSRNTCVPITSNAKIVNFINNEITTSSRSQYNLEITSDSSEQNFTIDGGILKMITPADSQPVYGAGPSIGLNTYHTNVIMKNVVAFERENYFPGKSIGIAMADSNIQIINSEVNVDSIGSKNKYQDNGIELDKSLIIKGKSKVTIDKFVDLSNNDLKKIIIDSGSVVLPENTDGTPNIPDGTTLTNSNDEDLIHFAIKKKDFKTNYDLMIPENQNNPGYVQYNYSVDPDKLHNGIANIWTPAISLKYFKNAESQIAGENPIQSEFIPRGQSAELMNIENPTINGNKVKWAYAKPIGKTSNFELSEKLNDNTELIPNIKSHNVEFDKNYVGKPENTIVKVEKGKSINGDNLTDQNMPENPIRNGFTFTGWNTNADGSGESFTGDTLVSTDKTVFAIWKKIPSTETKDETNTETKDEVNTETKNEVNTETKDEVNTETKNEVNTETKNEVNTETKNEVNTETKNEVNTETKGDVNTKTKNPETGDAGIYSAISTLLISSAGYMKLKRRKRK